MKFKFIILMLLVCLLCGSVYASDNHTDLSSPDSDSLLCVDEQEVSEVIKSQENVDDLGQSQDSSQLLSDGPKPYSIIENEVLNTNKSVIVLDGGQYKFDESTGAPAIYINRPVTIDGNGSTFFCTDQIFLIKADNVVLKNINFKPFQNIITTTGHVIQWSGSNAVVENCQFDRLKFDAPVGGAINWRGENLTINNTVFTDVGIINPGEDYYFNTQMEYSTRGGAVSLSNLGRSLGNIRILNCRFDKCGSGKSTGAIYMDGTSDAENILINNTEFRNCFSGDSAVMDISANKNITIINSKFVGNTQYSHGHVTGYSSVPMISVECDKYILVDNCAFSDNLDYSGAGLLHLYGHTFNKFIQNCNFDGNNKQRPEVYNYGEFVKKELMSGPLVDGEVYISKDYLPFVYNCIFTGNYQTLHVKDDSCYLVRAQEVHNSTFNRNHAVGGSILDPCTGVYNSDFAANEANYSVINNVAHDTYEVLNCTFESNHGHNVGTVVNAERIYNCSFDSNRVDIHGGAIFLGSAVYVVQSFPVDIANCSFSSNFAKNGSGGAIFSEFDSLKITNCSFNGNYADHEGNESQKGSGGALFVKNANIDNCTFNRNDAYNGPGGAIYSTSYVDINNSKFIDNRAFRNSYRLDEYNVYEVGGAIEAWSIKVNNSLFDSNRAVEGGAAIDAIDIKFYNSNFTSNFGPEQVFFSDNDPIIINCTFFNAQVIENARDNNTRHLNHVREEVQDVSNVINNTFDCYDHGLKANQTVNGSSWVLISGFFNAGVHFTIPDLYLINETGLENGDPILLPIHVNDNITIGIKKSGAYNLTGLIPGKYVVSHYYKDARGNVYVPFNNLTNVTFYIGRYLEATNGTYNTTNTTVYFVFEPNEYNGTNWTVFNSSGDIVKKGNNASFIKKNIGYLLNFTDLDAGNYTLLFNVPHNGSSYNITCNFTIYKAKSKIIINNNIANSVFNTTSVIVNVTVWNQTSLKLIINGTLNSSLYNVSVIIRDGNVTFDVVKEMSCPDINITAVLKQVNQTRNYIFTISGLNSDNYVIHFNNTESDNYQSSHANKAFKVLKAKSLVNITNITNAVYNASGVMINVSVLNQTNLSFVISNSTGSVSVNVTVVNDEVILTYNATEEFKKADIVANLTKHAGLNYTYSFMINALNAGDYNIVFLNNQSSNYYESKVRKSFKVYRASSSINITNITNGSYNSTASSFNVSVLNQTNVSFVISNKTGSITVDVKFNGDDVNLTVTQKKMNVNVSVKADLVNRHALDYNYTFTIFGLNAGEYDVIVHNAQNNNFNASRDNASFMVYKVNSSVEIVDVINSTYNVSAVNITYKVVNLTNVSYLIVNALDGSNFTVVSSNNKFEVKNPSAGLNTGNYHFNLIKTDDKFIFSIKGIEGGNYTITIFNHESDNFNASNDTCNFKVMKTPSKVIINDACDGVYNASDVIVNVTVINQTDVSFVISNGTSTVTVNLTVKNNKVDFKFDKTSEFKNFNVVCKSYAADKLANNYILVISGLNSGDYNVTVLNNQSQNYINSSDKKSFKVDKSNSTVDVAAKDGVFNSTGVVIGFAVINQTDLSKVYFEITDSAGDKFNVTLLKIVNGNVDVSIGRLTNQFNDVAVKGTLLSNISLVYKYSFVINGLVVGNYNVTVYNGETRNYAASKNNDTFNVTKAASKIDVSATDGIFNTKDVVVDINVCNNTSVSFVIGNITSNFTVKVNSDKTITIGGNTGRFANVTIEKSITSNNNNWSYAFVISGFNAGSYNITVFNDENANYNASANNNSFEVFKASTDINISNVNPGVYDTVPVVLNVTVVNQTHVSLIISNQTHNFTVKVNDDGTLDIDGNIEIKNKGFKNNYSFVISGLNAGIYNVAVLNGESENYNASSDKKAFVVGKAQSNVSIINAGNAIYNTTAVTVTVDIINQTNVSFAVGNSTYNFTVNIINNTGNVEAKIINNVGFKDVKVYADYNGRFTFTIYGLNAGNYNITVFNGESINYNMSCDNASFTVYKANSTVNITDVLNGSFNVSPVNVTYYVLNQTNVSFFIINDVTGANFTVINTGDGLKVVNATSTLNVDNYKFKLVKDGNNYVLSIMGVEGGKYSISARNAESLNYNSSQHASKFRVYRTPSLVNITSEADGVYATSDVCVNVVIVNQTEVSITVSNETHAFAVNLTVKDGNVIFTPAEFGDIKFSGKLNKSGNLNNYAISISGLEVGEYKVSVFNNQSDSYDEDSDQTSFEVFRANTAINLTAIDGVYNTSDAVVDFTVINQTDLSKVHFVVVDETGRKFNVNLTGIENDELKFDVSGLFSGLKISGKVISKNRYSFNISNLAIGKYNVTVFNGQTRNYNASNNTQSFNVTKASSKVDVGVVDGIYDTCDVPVIINVYNKTSISFVIGNSTSNFTVNVNGDGSISYAGKTGLFDNVSILNFKETKVSQLDYAYDFIISGLNAGKYSISVSNIGSDYYNACVADESFEVSKASSKVNVSAFDGIYDTMDVVINIDVVNQTDLSFVISNATHNFTVKLNNGNIVHDEGIVVKKIYSQLHNYTFTVSGLDAGEYDVTVLNNQSANYNASGDVNSFNVAKAASQINVTAEDGVYNTTDVIVTISVLNETAVSFDIINDEGLSGTVNLSVVGGKVVSAIDDKIGDIKVNSAEFANNAYMVSIHGLAAGNYNITVRNALSRNYNSSSDKNSFVVNKANTTVDIIRVIDGIYNTSNVQVTLKVVNKTEVTYTVKFRNGTVVLNNMSILEDNFIISNLIAGNYTLVVNNLENSNYNFSNDAIDFTVTKASSQIKTSAAEGIYNTRDVVVNVSITNQTDLSKVYLVISGSDLKFNVALKGFDADSVITDNVNVKGKFSESDLGYDYVFTVSGLSAGDYKVEVLMNESDNYNASSDADEFKVYRASSSINVSALDGIFDTRDVVLNVAIDNQTDLSKVYLVITNSSGSQFKVFLTGINGDVVSTDNVNVKGKVTVNYLHYDYVFTFSGLAADDYNVEVHMDETDKFNASKDNGAFAVIKASSKIDVLSQDAIYNTTNVIIIVSVVNETYASFTIVNAEGKSFTVNLNNSDYTSVDNIGAVKVEDIKFENGKYTLSISGLAAGKYDVSAKNSQTDNYNASIDTDSFNVFKAPSTVDVSKIVDGIYDTLNVNVDLSVVNRTLVVYTVKYSNGTVLMENMAVLEDNFTIIDLPAGSYVLVVNNTENENYTHSSDSIEFTVNKASSDVNISQVIGGIYDTSSATVKFNIVNETSVEFIVRDDNGIRITDCSINRNDFAIQISGLMAGNYSIEIINHESSNYNASMASQKFSIAKASSQVVINPIVNVTFNSKNIVVDYEIFNRTSSTVKVYNSNGDLIQPRSVTESQVLFDRIAAGNYSIEITNDENDNYNSSYAVSSFTVYRAGSAVVIDPIVNVTYGYGKILVNYGVSNRTSDVEILIKDKTTGIAVFSFIDVNKEAFLVIPSSEMAYVNMSFGNLNPGQYIFDVINHGNENFSESEAIAEFEIYAKRLDMNVSVINSTYPEMPKVIVKSDVDGDYNVVVDGKSYPVSVVNGTGSVAIGGLDSGIYNVTATSNVLNYEKINKTSQLSIDDGSIDMNVSVANPTYPESGVVSVTSDVDGDYAVVVDGKNYIVKVVNGTGNVTIDKLQPGSYDVDVTSNIENYGKVSKTLSLSVNRNNVPTVEAEDLIRGYNSDHDFKAMFYDKNGAVLMNTAVEFDIAGKTYSVFTDSSGVAFLKLKLDVGNYNVTSRNPVTEDETTNSLQIVKRLIENKNVVADFNSGYVYKIRVIDDDGTPVGAGVKFSIPINGKYYSYVTDSKGYINIKLDKRFVPSLTKNKLTYRFTLTYKEFTINNVVTIKQILKSKKTVKVKKSANKLVLKATIKNSNGKALKNKKILFKFKGKTYKAKTNKKGVAKVTIKKNVIKKLRVGKAYKVQISYLTDKIKSYVKVKK